MNKERLRTDAISIFDACVKAVDPEASVLNNLRLDGVKLSLGNQGLVNLDDYERIVVVGAGKASARMAAGLERILGERIEGGAGNSKDRTCLSIKDN